MEGEKKYSPAFGMTQLAESVRSAPCGFTPVMFIFFGVVVETPMIGSMPALLDGKFGALAHSEMQLAVRFPARETSTHGSVGRKSPDQDLSDSI
jgi:hypothetical protein